jgi:formylglycine-generating enzyme required for sulfatase activity/serine/threonine protein kinase
MESRAATHPSDETLSLFALGKIDDRAAETVGQHLAKCADCRRRAAELSSIRSVEQTHATAHLGDETLTSYSLGKVDDTVAETVGRHLAKCPDCRRRAAELSTIGRTAAPRNSPTQPGKTASDKQRSEKPDASGGVSPGKRTQAPLKGLPEGLADHPQYQIECELGRGGIGIVYLARNKLMDRKEVLKVLTREMLSREGATQRFLQEIQSAARLNHPNVVAAYSAFQVGDLLVFAMEYVEGSDLAKLVRERGPLPIVNACYFAYQAAQGLQHAHERGMIHRDIKPSNLILFRQGKRAVVKILDFGLAKAASEQGVEASLTQEGQMLGTPDYIAPEQTLDAQKADIRADLYSLGCTLYHLLAGRPPFRGASLYEILQAHHSVEAEPLNQVRAEVPPELANVVAKMMAKNPADRFQSPSQVVDALKPFLKMDLPRSGTLIETDETIRKSLLSGLQNRGGSVAADGTAGFQSGMTQVESPGVGRSTAKNRAASAPVPPPLPFGPETKSSRSAAAASRGAAGASSKKRPLLSKAGWMWTAVGIAGVLVGFGGAWLGGAFTTKSNDSEAKATNDSAKPNNAALAIAPSQDATVQPVVNAPAVNAPAANVPAANASEANLPASNAPVPASPTPPSNLRQGRRSQMRTTPTFASRPMPPSQGSNPFFNRNVAPERDDNAILMKFVRIPNGEFLMGEKPDEGSQQPGQSSVPVRISKEFWLGKCEVTQLQWRQVMQTSPWSGQADVKEGNDYPATYVDWQDATQFCEKLSEEERGAGRLQFNMKYVLPTEAQWEFACRAGTTTRFSFGDDESKLSEYAWFGNNASAGGENHANPVGQKLPNALGLLDMHGNVGEWCRDGEGPALLGGLDPEVTSGGVRRMSRGGSFADAAKDCRSAGRRALEPTHRDRALGFRVALSNAPRTMLRRSTRTLIVSPQSQPSGRFGRSNSTFPSVADLTRGIVAVPVRDDNGLQLKLIRIAPGSFKMGSTTATTAQMARDRTPQYRPKGTPRRRRPADVNAHDEGAVDVDLTSEFWLGKDEVTQAQWQQVMRTTPWHAKSQVMEGNDYPATYVSWNDAAAFCKKLTDSEHQTGRLQTDSEYKLPTEAQWEYACRAGTQTQFSFGRNEYQLSRYAWFGAVGRNGFAAREPYAHECGRKASNPWGLDDMHGNVCEWCRDNYKEKLPGGTDPEVGAGGSNRVIRGGGWSTPAAGCASAARAPSAPAVRRNDLGFRVAIVSSGQAGGQPGNATAEAVRVAPAQPPATTASAPAEKTPKVAALSPDNKKAAGDDVSPFAGNRAGQIREDNGLKTMLVWIPPGSFTMGTKVDRDHRQNEGPAEVTVTNGFWLAKYELTQAEWRHVMQTAPWHGELFVKEGEEFPATYLKWDDATAFCTKLTIQEHAAARLPSDWQYTLPTEAQWEYACRAGTTTPYGFGKAVSELPEYAWFAKNVGGSHEEYAHQVGGKNANRWGLHDVHGNVSEWCRDGYAKDLPGGTDPEVSTDGQMRVLRGGGWRSNADDCRSSFRQGASSAARNATWGFRIVAVKSGK